MLTVDSNELNRTSRLLDINRQRLEEIKSQIGRIENLQLEHDDTRTALNSISKGQTGHIPLGAGVMVKIPKSNTVIIDFGSGIFGEVSIDVAESMVSDRLTDLGELKNQFQKDSDTVNNRISSILQDIEKISSRQVEEGHTLQETPEPSTKTTSKTKRRRKRGSELTLDD